MTKLETSNTILFLSRYPPEAHGPAWERIKHMASACGVVFGKSVILTFQSGKSSVRKKVGSRVLLYEARLIRESPFPINAYFDPIKFILLTILGLIFSLRLKPRFILGSMPPSEVGVSAWLIAKLLSIDLVVDLRDDWESAIEQKLSNYIPTRLLKTVFWLTRKVYSFSTVILVATQTIGKSAGERGVETRTILVPNGADTSIFVPKSEDRRVKLRKKYSIPQTKLVMLYCGSGVNPYYRLDRVLAALNSLPKHIRNRLLLVFYLYNGIEKVLKMKEDFGLSNDVVEVREPVSRPVLAEIMAACDIGLVPFDDMPYLLCARSAKLYEYLSAGLCVIASGPKNGELDRLFASNPALGTFSLPSQRNFSEIFHWVVENRQQISNENNRFLRHEFIRENHERMGIMIWAMNEVRSMLSAASK